MGERDRRDAGLRHRLLYGSGDRSSAGECGRNVEVTQPGGVLKVEQQEDGTVFMQGPSHFVFEGVYEYEA